MDDQPINPILLQASDIHRVPVASVDPKLQSAERIDGSNINNHNSAKKRSSVSPEPIDGVELIKLGTPDLQLDSPLQTLSSRSSKRSSKVVPIASDLPDDEEDLEINHKKTNIDNIDSSSSPLLSRKSSRYPFPRSHGIDYLEDMFSHSPYLSPLMRKTLQLSLLTILGIFIFLVVFIYTNNFQWIPSTSSYNPSYQTTTQPQSSSPVIIPTPTYRLTFLGDSLINRPMNEFDLGGRLQRRFSTINLNITDHSVEGNTIARIRKTVDQDMRPGSADMMIMLWDTDVSDYDESTMSPEEIAQKRFNYLEDLYYVINVTKAAGVKHIAIAGPDIFGEGPWGEALLPSYLLGKTKMLEDYVTMNEEAAKKTEIDYINMRQAFLDHLPSYWVLSLYYLTWDGEHPNYRGAGLIAQQFADQIGNWTGAPVNS